MPKYLHISWYISSLYVVYLSGYLHIRSAEAVRSSLAQFFHSLGHILRISALKVVILSSIGLDSSYRWLTIATSSSSFVSHSFFNTSSTCALSMMFSPLRFLIMLSVSFPSVLSNNSHLYSSSWPLNGSTLWYSSISFFIRYNCRACVSSSRNNHWKPCLEFHPFCMVILQ